MAGCRFIFRLVVRVSVALCAAVVFGFAWPAIGGATELPNMAATDVSESYHLITTSFYRHVDAQAVVDGALTALSVEAQRHGAHVVLPAVHAVDESTTVDQLDATIVHVAELTHLSPEQATYAAIEGMAGAVDDRYTQFMTPDDFRRFNDALDPEKISGIGVLVQPDPVTAYISLTYVVPDTPADRAGLLAGDDIVTAEGVSTKGMTVEDVTKLLRGRAGTPLHLTVSRDGTPLAAPLVLVRTAVSPPTVVYRMLPDRIAYLAVFAFGRETPDEFDAALTRIRDAGARALVLDLRNNGGGYVNSALEITSRFIANKTLVTVEDRGSHVTSVQADNDAVLTLPLAVLVNQYSASASEIAAGALQDNGIATLVGMKTFGKGVMQTVTPLADGSAIKITTAHYLTPANHDINLRGIEPDVVVDENRDAHFGEILSDAQLRAALDVVEKKIALSTGKGDKS